MSKLSISQKGIHIETHEKSNVMTSFNNGLIIISVFSLILLIWGIETWIKILGGILIFSYTIVWLIVYCTHSIKKPELLQSEIYRLERQKIETGMIEDKARTYISSKEITQSNISLLSNNTQGEADV